MLDLSTGNKAAISSDKPWEVAFVEIIPNKTDVSTHFRVCNHFRDLDTISEFHGTETEYTYTATANLMNISSIKDDLEVKEGGVKVTLSGLSRTVISLMLDSTDIIQGSRIYLSRGFIDHDTGNLVADPYRRWAGYIDNYSIEDRYDGNESDTVKIGISCISDLPVLLSSKNGRYTSIPGFQRVDSTDLSMEYVAATVDWAPNFYKAPPDPGGSGKHLCTRYWEFGDISDDVFLSDNAYRGRVSDKLYNWYSSWAKDMAEVIEHGTIKYYLVKPFVMAWSQSMHYKMTGRGKRSYFGEFLEWLGNKLC